MAILKGDAVFRTSGAKSHYFQNVFLFLFVFLYPSAALAGLDYPHSAVSAIGCNSCHDVSSSQPQLMPEWTARPPEDIDDTQFNILCWSCHNDIEAPYMPTHSSLNAGDKYGDWTVECWVCHNQHSQAQLREYGASGYLYSEASTGITELTITRTGAGWTVDQYAGLVVVPNTANIDFTYSILSNTADTLTVRGPMDLSQVTVGDSFAVVYGKLIRSTVLLDDITNPASAKTGDKTVIFLRSSGMNSFADGDMTYDGICEVCHTETTHFRNDGSGSDQLHTNVGTPAGSSCMDCHNHSNGFGHGGGSGTGCNECHGHDPGYGGATGGAGTYKSHSTHTENDADDLRGPNVDCDACHDTNDFPYFKTGTDTDGDGRFSLSETDVCNSCHSPAGTYDGVDNPEIGVKYGNYGVLSYNWRNRVYDDGDNQSLLPGNEKWCATCHDESPSIIDVPAPNVIGDEGGVYTYGTGWGYYKTGHGLTAGEEYPSKGGLQTLAGRPVECGSCHDSTLSHLDGTARSFDCSDGCDPDEYQQSYRLESVQGYPPMTVPWPLGTYDNRPDKYRLCAGCHDTGPYTDAGNFDTNMRQCAETAIDIPLDWDTTDPDNPFCTNDNYVNYHQYHLNWRMHGYPADYDYAVDYVPNSQMTCVTCHNVHGSTRMAMVRDGKLINREPGLRLWYTKTGLTTGGNNPEDLPLSASDGKLITTADSTNLCKHCHGSTRVGQRYPYESVSSAPLLDWTGASGYISDGSSPDSAVYGSTFTFGVKYTQHDNTAPAAIQLWIDLYNNGDYEDLGEKIDLNESDTGDTTFYNGKLYTVSIDVDSAGDDVIDYRFHASDGNLDATGAPTHASSITLVSPTGGGGASAPTLAWTGEIGFTDDGVNPDREYSGTSFTFRVEYTDADDDAPVLIQMWIDEDADGAYSATEKHDLVVDGGDGDYTNGERYTVSLVLNAIGGGSLQYRFYAFDGVHEGTGLPTAEETVTVINNAPVLDWSGEVGYTDDGVDPDNGVAGSTFTFRAEYTQVDNVAPAAIQVWVDTNDSGTYEPGEQKPLFVSGGDGDYSNGEIFSSSLALAHVGDGVLNYRFYANDGTDPATGIPNSDAEVTVSAPVGNNAPVLSWYTADCLTKGVRPETGAENVDFEFMVSYTDSDSQCADIIQVWVDENNNGFYDSNEKHDLAGLDSGDTDCSDGKIYSAAVLLPPVGSATLSYRFFATDGLEAATGIPVSNAEVTVLAAEKVRPLGGTGWFTTIQGGVDISGEPSTILVYPNADFSAATYAGDTKVQAKNYRTVRSVCGPDLTIISGTGTGSALLLQSSNNTELDGFTVTNVGNTGTGIYVDHGDNVTVKNNKIYGNTYGMQVNNGAIAYIENNEIYGNSFQGIHTNASTTTVHITDSDIHDNAGSGIFFNNGVHTITDTEVRDNSTGGDGGGIYFNGTGAGTTVTNTTISNNTTMGGRGGGMFFANGAQATFDKCTISGNQAPTTGGGGMYVMNTGTYVVINNSIVADNQAAYGGAAYIHSGKTLFINDTFAYNRATVSEGGVFRACTIVEYIVVRNSIFWGNTAATGGAIGSRNGCNANELLLDIAYSDVTEDDIVGIGSIFTDNINPAQDPLFIGAGNYHIQLGSPVIGEANAAYAPIDDIDGDIRPQGVGDDMGADEYVP